MAGNNRNRHCDGQNAGHGASGADEPTDRTRRHLVSVADRRHGNDGPPEGVGDAVDGGAGDLEFGVVDGAGVKHYARAQRHDEDAQTLHARSKSRYQYLNNNDDDNKKRSKNSVKRPHRRLVTSRGGKGKKLKVGFFYSVIYAAMPRPGALYNHRK